MTIAVFAAIAELPAGVPGRIGDPLGVFGGESNVLGDATGGSLTLAFMVPNFPNPLELARVYVIDWVSAEADDLVDFGALRVAVVHHHELANVTLDNTRTHIVPADLTAVVRVAQTADLQRWLSAMPVWWRRDLGGTDGERMFVRLSVGVNNLGQTIRFRVGGRYYDARVLATRDFWGLFHETQNIP